MPFPYNSQTYYEFFEAIAINHIDIQHNADRAENEVRFGEIYISSDPFDKIDLSSFMDDKRSKIQYPLLLMVGSDWDATGKGSQTNALVNASFIVLDKGDKTKENKADIRRSAYVKTEAIAEDIVAYIKEYFKLNVVLGTLFIDSIKSSKIGPLPEGTYGTKVDFNYLNRNSNFCFNQDKFLLLAPAVDAVPDKCDPVPNPDYCDLFFSKLSAQQLACVDAIYTFESDFEANTTEIEEGQSVTFTPDYDDADVYYWDFGDGEVSALKTPTHTYTTAGNYTVCLILVDGDRHSKVLKVDYIVVAEPDFLAETIAYMNAIGIVNDTTVYYEGTDYEVIGSEIWNGVDAFFTSISAFKTKFENMYLSIGGNSTRHKFNAVDPQDLDASHRLLFYNAWVHSATGMKTNGVNTYADMFLTPANDLQLNSCGACFYTKSTAVDGGTIFGVDDGVDKRFWWFAYYATSGNNSQINIHSSAAFQPHIDLGGFHSINRTNNSTINYFKNGVKSSELTTLPVDTLANRSLYLGASNVNGSMNYPSNIEFSFFAIKYAHLTDAEELTLYNAVLALQTILGRN